MSDDSYNQGSGTNLDFSLDSQDTYTQQSGSKLDFSLTKALTVDVEYDAVLQETDLTTTVDYDAVIVSQATVNVDYDTVIQAENTVTPEYDTVIQDSDQTVTVDYDTVVASQNTVSVDYDTVIKAERTVTPDYDVVVKDEDVTTTVDYDAAIVDVFEIATEYDTVIQDADQVLTVDYDTRIADQKELTVDYDAYISHGRPGAVTVYIDGTEYKTYANIKIKKRLNEMNDIEFEAYIEDDNDRALLQEGAEVEIFEGTDNLLFKGRLNNVEYESNFRAQCEGFGMEVKLLNRKTPRVEYDNTGADNIVKQLVTTEIMQEGTIENAPVVSLRFDHDNKLRAIAGAANAVGYDWYISQKKSEGYDKDYLNFVERKGSSTSQKTYDIGNNARMVERNKDTEHIANDITMLGRGDGINQLEANVFAASTHRTVTAERLKDADTTSLDVKDASQLGADGDTVHVRVGTEVIEGTLDVTNDQVDISSRGAKDYDGNSTEVITHYKDIQVWLQENVTQGIGPFKPTKSGAEAGSSIDSYGVREEKVTDRTIINKPTLEKVADNELKDRRQDIFRVQIKPTDPRTTKEIELGDTVTAKDLTAMDVNNEFRVVGMDINRASGGEGTVLHLANRPLRLTERLRDIKRSTDTTSTHMQGATNIDSQNFGDNCDNSHPLKTELRIPSDAVAVNKAEIAFSREPFRGYVKNQDHSHTVDVTHPSHSHDIDIGSDTSTAADVLGTFQSGSASLSSDTTLSDSEQVSISGSVDPNSSGHANATMDAFIQFDENQIIDIKVSLSTLSLSHDMVTSTDRSGALSLEMELPISQVEDSTFELTIENYDGASRTINTNTEWRIDFEYEHNHDVDFGTKTSNTALGTTSSETSSNSGAPSYGIFEPSSEPDVDVDVVVDGTTVTTVSNVSVGQTINPIDIKSELSEPIAGAYHTIKLIPVDTGGGNGGRSRLNATVFSKVFVESKL